MREHIRVWAVLAIAYAAAAQINHLLWTNRFDLSVMMAATTLAVPTVQLALFVLVAKVVRTEIGRYGERLGLGGFFIGWLVGAVSLGATRVAVGFLLFNLLDLTAAAMARLLFVPAAQAAALVAATSRSWKVPDWHGVAAHPLAWPVLALDGLMLPAGWIWASHPLVGLADAAVMQRRWMGTKFMVAALMMAIVAFRQRGVPGATPQAPGLAAALLAAIGFNGFVAWMFASAGWAPAPIANQPLTLIWLEGYAVFTALFLWSVLSAARALEALAPDAAGLHRAGSVLIFLSLLSLLMNGYLSWLPVHPWAGLALTLGSLAGTSFCLAALVLPPTTARASQI